MSEAAAKLIDLTMRMHGGIPSPEAPTIANRLLNGIARLLDDELDGGCPDCKIEEVGEHDALISDIVDSFMTRYSTNISGDPNCRAFVYMQVLRQATKLRENPAAWR